ncbi:MAG: response regulator [Candidatus Latescibacterota bacterium]
MEGRCRGRILVVDDEKPVADVLERCLVQCGYYVRQALGFGDVQRRLAEEPFDLVTLDITMPEVGGLEVLRWLKEQYPDMGVVMATGQGEAQVVIEAMRLGAYDYLVKPFSMDLVAAELDQAMARQRLVAENRAYRLRLEGMVEERTRQLEDANEALQRKVRELEGLEQLIRFHMVYHTVQEAQAEVLRILGQVLDIQQIIIYWASPESQRLQPVAALGLSAPGVLEDERGMAALAALPMAGADLVARTYRGSEPGRTETGEITIPLAHRGVVQGVLWAKGITADWSQDESYNVLWRLGQEAALVLWSAQVMERVEKGGVPVDELLKLGDEDHG